MTQSSGVRAMAPRARLAPPPNRQANVEQLERYSGNYVPIVGGAIQFHYGLKELHNTREPNHVENGLVDVGLGGAHAAGNLAMMPCYAHAFMHVAAPLLRVAGHVYATCSIVGSVIDGGRDIYNGLTMHEPRQTGVGAAKITAGSVSALGALMLNPFVMFAGSVMYAGAVAYQNWDALKAGCQKLFPHHPTPAVQA